VPTRCADFLISPPKEDTAFRISILKRSMLTMGTMRQIKRKRYSADQLWDHRLRTRSASAARAFEGAGAIFPARHLSPQYDVMEPLADTVASFVEPCRMVAHQMRWLLQSFVIR
jgi:hypothetical protein